MAMRKFTFVSVYNVLLIVFSVSLLVMIMTFLIDKYTNFPPIKSGFKDTLNLSRERRKISTKINGTLKEPKVLNMACNPIKKIGFLKIHKAASRSKS